MAEGWARLSEWRYKVLGSGTLTAADIPSWARQIWRPGDTAMLARWWQCLPDDDCVTASRDDPDRALGEGCAFVRCTTRTDPWTYVLRRRSGGWRFVEDYFEPVLDPEFWNRR